MKLGTKGYDPLSARRAEEVDAVIEELAQFAGPPPTKVDTMFEQLLLSYVVLRSRGTERVTVLLGQAGYDRAKDSGLLAWFAERYPLVTFESPSKVVRGCHADKVFLDEAMEF